MTPNTLHRCVLLAHLLSTAVSVPPPITSGPREDALISTSGPTKANVILERVELVLQLGPVPANVKGSFSLITAMTMDDGNNVDGNKEHDGTIGMTTNIALRAPGLPAEAQCESLGTAYCVSSLFMHAKAGQTEPLTSITKGFRWSGHERSLKIISKYKAKLQYWTQMAVVATTGSSNIKKHLSGLNHWLLGYTAFGGSEGLDWDISVISLRFELSALDEKFNETMAFTAAGGGPAAKLNWPPVGVVTQEGTKEDGFYTALTFTGFRIPRQAVHFMAAAAPGTLG